jgi:hypothetical protein
MMSREQTLALVRQVLDAVCDAARLMACLSTDAASPPMVLLNRIFTAVREFCLQADQSDDITVTVTRFC